MSEEKKDQLKKTVDRYLSVPKYKYFIKTLKELAVPIKYLDFKCFRDGRPSTGEYLSPDNDGNIRFYTPTIDGDIETYTTDTKNVKVHDWYLTRFIEPKKTADGVAKYMPVRGGGTRLFLTPQIVESYRAKKEIKTIYLIEGFKKAFAMYLHGNLPVIGMNGLTGFKEPGKERIRAELRDLLKTCDVKKVVILYDSDLFELGRSKEKATTTRPNNFYRACLSAKSLIENFADVTLVHPTPNPEKKFGFDDLLLEHREKEFTNEDLLLEEVKSDKGHERIFKALEQTLSEGKNDLFQALKLTSIQDFKIRSYFNLDDAMSFFTFHRDELVKRKKFSFYTHKYFIKADGTFEEIKEDETFGLTIDNNQILKDTKNGKTIIATFNIKVLFRISGDDPIRIAELTNTYGEKAIIEVTPEDLNSPQRFNSITMGAGNFIYKGGRDELLDLSQLLFKHEKPAITFKVLGYQPRFMVYAFANGLVTPDGWRECDDYGIVEYNDNIFYFPAFSKFNIDKEDLFAEIRKYSHYQTQKQFSFSQWFKQFTTVYGDNGYIAASFYMASLFSDIVFSHRSGIGFPILWSAGKPKTGKSTICQSILSLFGDGILSDSLTASSTIKYKAARFSQLRNATLHFDEYKTNDIKTQDFLKSIFDRLPSGTKAFTNDSKTRLNYILSSLMVSGEVLPTDNHALFTRTLLMIFNVTEDQRSETERNEFKILSRMEENGLTSVTVELLKHRHLIEKYFDEVYQSTYDEINNFLGGANIIDGRMKKSAAWIMSVVKVLVDYEAIELNIAWVSYVKLWCKNLQMQDQQIKTNTDAAKFWDVIEILHRNQKISEASGDFIIKNGLLIVRLNRLIAPYTEEAYKQKMTKVLDKASLKNYLENEPYYIPNFDKKGRPKKMRFTGSKAPVEAMWLNYDQIVESFGIDLTRDITATGDDPDNVDENDGDGSPF